VSGLSEYLAGGNDGPGGTSGWNVPKPCKRCGAPRPKGLGRGRYYCDPCQAERDAEKNCFRCGQPKPPGRGKRLCDTCLPKHATKPCHGCGERKPKVGGGPYCADCRDLKVSANTARRRARRRLKDKQCRGLCGRQGPFYMDNGKNTPYCQRCRAERFGPSKCVRCKQRPTRAKHKKLCAVCWAEARSAEQARRRELDAGYRRRRDAAGGKRKSPDAAKRNESRRLQRRLTAEKQGRSIPPVSVTPRSDENANLRELPAAPLAVFIETLIEQESVGIYSHGPDLVFLGETGNRLTRRQPDLTNGLPWPRETVCNRLGISVKSQYDWAHGKRKKVRFDIADRVLTKARVCWWDVWKTCGALRCSCAECQGAGVARDAFEGPGAEMAA